MILTPKPGRLVDSPIGKKPLDSSGSTVGAARMNPENTFKRISELIQDYINNSDDNAWKEIWKIIDNVYSCVSAAMDALEAEAPFSREVIKQMKSGKRLFSSPTW